LPHSNGKALMPKPMHFRNLDLNLLVALDALLLDRSITRAGKRVHLSQSAMSGALSRLREYFGDEILSQIGRRMIPTPLGESLAAPVRKLLLEIQATVAAQPSFDPGTAKRTFRLMMSDYVSTVLMSAALPVIERLAPHVSIEILSNDVESPFDELDRADIDLLIMPERYLNDAQPYEVLFEDEFIGITWKDNTLIPADGRLSLEAYMNLGHGTSRFASARAATVDDWFISQLGYKRNVEVITMNFTSVVSSIPGTKRVATIHRRLAEYFAQYLPIRLFDAPFEVPRLTEAVQWHRHFNTDRGLLWLREVLHDAATHMRAAGCAPSARVVPLGVRRPQM
jgi:LysR family transcriptional regulator, nod-box dependent transcriptional activator